MITSCTVCEARYKLESDKVPARIIKVRCPACGSVFELDGTVRDTATVDTMDTDVFSHDTSAAQGAWPESSQPDDLAAPVQPEAPEPTVQTAPQEPVVSAPVTAPPAAMPPAAAALSDDSVHVDPESHDESFTAQPMAAEPPSPPAAAPARETRAAATVTADEEAGSKPSGRRRKCKEEMLARALVSDILVYNRELRDSALADGTLLESLGGEIKKSWELYKEKVTPEVANSTNYFRDALNDILAEGESVF